MSEFGNPEYLDADGYIFSASEWQTDYSKIRQLAMLFAEEHFPKAFSKWMSGSKARDENGNPWLFHITSDLQFKQFDTDKMELGIHAGTFDHAWERGLGLIRRKHADKLRLITVAMRILNPIQMHDQIEWTPYAIYIELGKIGLLKTQTAQQLATQCMDRRDRGGTALSEKQRCSQYLQQLGFDGVEYVNLGEAAESKNKSYIALSPQQVLILPTFPDRRRN